MNASAGLGSVHAVLAQDSLSHFPSRQAAAEEHMGISSVSNKFHVCTNDAHSQVVSCFHRTSALRSWSIEPNLPSISESSVLNATVCMRMPTIAGNMCGSKVPIVRHGVKLAARS